MSKRKTHSYARLSSPEMRTRADQWMAEMLPLIEDYELDAALMPFVARAIEEPLLSAEVWANTISSVRTYLMVMGESPESIDALIQIVTAIVVRDRRQRGYW